MQTVGTPPGRITLETKNNLDRKLDMLLEEVAHIMSSIDRIARKLDQIEFVS